MGAQARLSQPMPKEEQPLAVAENSFRSAAVNKEEDHVQAAIPVGNASR